MMIRGAVRFRRWDQIITTVHISLTILALYDNHHDRSTLAQAASLHSSKSASLLARAPAAVKDQILGRTRCDAELVHTHIYRLNSIHSRLQSSHR